MHTKYIYTRYMFCFNLDPMTSHILDTVSGLPAAGVEGTLLKWLPGSWQIISTR